MRALALSLVKFSLDKPDAPAHTHPKQSVPTKMLSLFPASKHGILQIFERTKKKKSYDLWSNRVVMLSVSEDSCYFVLGTKSARQMRVIRCMERVWRDEDSATSVPPVSSRWKGNHSLVIAGAVWMQSVVIILIFSWSADGKGGEFAVQSFDFPFCCMVLVCVCVCVSWTPNPPLPQTGSFDATARGSPAFN